MSGYTLYPRGFSNYPTNNMNFCLNLDNPPAYLPPSSPNKRVERGGGDGVRFQRYYSLLSFTAYSLLIILASADENIKIQKLCLVSGKLLYSKFKKS